MKRLIIILRGVHTTIPYFWENPGGSLMFNSLTISNPVDSRIRRRMRR